jgi:hypothetical protein
VDLTFGRTRVEIKVEIFVEQHFQMIRMFRFAAHVRSDPD